MDQTEITHLYKKRKRSPEMKHPGRNAAIRRIISTKRGNHVVRIAGDRVPI
jgi:hypothetical protein